MGAFLLLGTPGQQANQPPPPTGPTLEEGLVSYLAAVPGVIALLGSAPCRIYPALALEGSTYPACTYQRISTRRIRSLTGSSQLAKARIQLTAHAPTYSAAKQTAEALRNALDCYHGAMGNVTVQGCFLEADADDLFPSPDLAANLLYGVRLDLLIVYEEPAPSH